MIHTYYYLNEKIGYGEMDIPLSITTEEAKKLIPKHYEKFIVEFLAEILGGNIEKTLRDEIDGIITRKKKILAVIEVKTGSIGVKDVEIFVRKTKDLGIRAPRIVVSSNKVNHSKVISLDINDIMRLATNPKIIQELELS